ncbi:MAG TPA: MaoC family dehydratase [Acetobacteraceae bacterium]|nr:MaoC family dehydratase [Acetobacteraceae bacterium]
MSENKAGADDRIYLEDFVVGQKRRSRTYTVTLEEIREFASRYDPQPFHLDEEAGRNSMFGGLVASGWHTAAITMRLIVDSQDKREGGTIGAGVEISWLKPTRPGDTLWAESEVIEVTPSHSRPDRGIVTSRTVTYNQDNEPVQILQSRAVAPRRPG